MPLARYVSLVIIVLLSEAAALHVAFVVPPASAVGAMLPVAHGCLDVGHNVTILAHDITLSGLQPLVPQARFVDLGPARRPHMDERRSRRLLNTPYELLPFFSHGAAILLFDTYGGWPLAKAALPELQSLKPDVVCTANIVNSVYSAAEAAGVPAVGLAFGPQVWMTVLDVPWSLEPALGAWYTREEISASPWLLALNIGARCFGSLLRVAAMVVHNSRRMRLGLSTWQADAFKSMQSSPLVVPSLPELCGGYAALGSEFTVMAGMYDHPAMQGASVAKSAQHSDIMKWLDGRHRNRVEVVYVAFGSEVVMDRGRLNLLKEAFLISNITSLWALKKPPSDLDPPSHIRVTPWAPQKAVLAHPAVTAFLTHGGMNSVREAIASGTPMLIMPVTLDTPTVATLHEKLGVALRLHKNYITPDVVASSIAKLRSQKFQERAKQVRDLNLKRADLSRAVEVIENVAARRFPADVPVRRGAVPAWETATFLAALALFSFDRCCCCCCRKGQRGLKRP
mmetsp:Transcript_30651/g.88879  ORF Transcript_30651/g.88879 Transcript_30651/m.88879 type:complete len:511 (-) Transcript_30651:142-1674(-)